MSENKQELPDLNEDQKKDLLKVLLRKALEEKNNENSNIPEKIVLLKQLKELYEKKIEFKTGDIIKWKNRLKNRKLPEYNEPIILLEILDNPIINEEVEFGSTYFNEKLDIKVGVLKENSFLTFCFDSSRFELYE